MQLVTGQQLLPMVRALGPRCLATNTTDSYLAASHVCGLKKAN